MLSQRFLYFFSIIIIILYQSDDYRIQSIHHYRNINNNINNNINKKSIVRWWVMAWTNNHLYYKHHHHHHHQSRRQRDDDNSIISLSMMERQYFLRNCLIVPSFIGVGIVDTKKITDNDNVAMAMTASTSTKSLNYRKMGAAELDLEYYVRDIITGNPREGPVSSSPVNPTNNNVATTPPRIMDRTFISLLVNDELNRQCITIRTLIDTMIILNERNSNKNNNIDDIEKEIQIKIQYYLDKTKKSFYNKQPWMESFVIDQYYFDYAIYAIWRTISDIIITSYDRDIYIRQLGRNIYQTLCNNGILVQQKQSNTANSNNKYSLVSTIPYLIEILNVLQTTQFIKGYQLGDDEQRNNNDNNNLLLFDEYDDEAIQNGMNVNCLISIYEPSILSTCLQLTGERTRFIPDYIGTIIAAMLEQQLSTTSSSITSTPMIQWETYFVDPIYRPNPKEYYPNEQLLQFSIEIKQK